MRTVTLAQLRTRVRRRADIEFATDRFPDGEILDELNESIAELYDEVLRARGLPFYRKVATVTATGASPLIPLPADLYQLVKVEFYGAGSAGYPLTQFTDEDHAYLASPSTARDGRTFYYQMRGAASAVSADSSSASLEQLEVLPMPSAGTAFVVSYVPASPKLSADTDLFDGFGGWEEYVVLDTAMKLMEKNDDQAKSQSLGAKKAALAARIAGMQPMRERTGPAHVVDVRGGMGRMPFGRRGYR